MNISKEDAENLAKSLMQESRSSVRRSYIAVTNTTRAQVQGEALAYWHAARLVLTKAGFSLNNIDSIVGEHSPLKGGAK